MSTEKIILKVKLPSCVRKIKINRSNSVEHRVGYSRLVKVVEEEFGCFEKAT